MTSREQWRVVSIKDVCEAIVDCVNKTAPTVEHETPYKMIRTSNVKGGWIDLDDVKFVEADVFAKWNQRTTPRQGDVILTREAPLGEVGMIRTSDQVFLGQRLVLYRADPEKLDNYFLLAAFQSDYVQGQVKSLGTGATVEHMCVPDAEKLTIKLPPLTVQHRIGKVLSAYDDLIENNTRRIKFLEQMARMLYREWFVNFRFPGYEKVKIVKSVLGLIPEGWNVEKLSSFVETQYGYTESATENRVGPKFLRGMDINKSSFIDWDSVPYCSIAANALDNYRLNRGDIVIIRMADPGKVGIVEQDVEAVFASYLIRLKLCDNALSPYYLFHFLLSDRYQDYVLGASTGTTRKSASAGVITGIHILVPSRTAREEFETRATVIRRLLNNLVRHNSVLRKTRDLLLSKLVSGEVSVEKIKCEAAAQTV